ncbi:Cob(I)yrinic acid a,c-diamide adenosyltransferase [compost metagenome]
MRPVQTDWLERQIDHFNADLAPLTSFILPGGTPLSTALHLARTVTRRAERLVAALVEVEPDTSPEALRYLNRLSDLLFVLGRVANANGSKDVLWVPGNYGDVKKAD